MSFLHWMAVLGSILLILTLASAYLRWLPVTTSTLYLAFGLGIGPLGLGLWKMNFIEVADWLEHLTEIAVLFSLFSGGMKLRLGFADPAWRSAYLLAVCGTELLMLSFGVFSVDADLVSSLQRDLWLVMAGVFVTIAFIARTVWSQVRSSQVPIVGPIAKLASAS